MTKFLTRTALQCHKANILKEVGGAFTTHLTGTPGTGYLYLPAENWMGWTLKEELKEYKLRIRNNIYYNIQAGK